LFLAEELVKKAERTPRTIDMDSYCAVPGLGSLLLKAQKRFIKWEASMEETLKSKNNGGPPRWKKFMVGTESDVLS
jgi:hypothetical protein